MSSSQVSEAAPSALRLPGRSGVVLVASRSLTRTGESRLFVDVSFRIFHALNDFVYLDTLFGLVIPF